MDAHRRHADRTSGGGKVLRPDDARGDATEVTFAVETLAGEHVGFTGLHRIDYRHGVAFTGSLIGRTDLWGQGLGTDLARTRTRYAFEVLGLRMLLSEALAENEASVRMLKRCGYTEVGRIPRRYFKRGAYRDALLFAIERSRNRGKGKKGNVKPKTAGPRR